MDVPRAARPVIASFHDGLRSLGTVLALHAGGSLATDDFRPAVSDFDRRPLTGVARAELLRGGVVVFGPPPAELLPPLDAALRTAVRAELSGYWTDALGRPHVWLQDVYVDLGLLTVARAEAAVTEGRLITKREAIGQLSRFGVPPDLIREIERRRAGDTVPLTDEARSRRAETARPLVGAAIQRVLALAPGSWSCGGEYVA